MGLFSVSWRPCSCHRIRLWRNAPPPPKTDDGANLNNTGDPSFIDVKMIGCGDESLNGAPPQASHYTMRAWVRQSSGQFYGRPAVSTTYRPWKNTTWLYGRIPTGGYVDNMWLQAVRHDGKRELHVLIKHESLDSKPSATSEYWFVQ